MTTSTTHMSLTLTLLILFTYPHQLHSAKQLTPSDLRSQIFTLSDLTPKDSLCPKTIVHNAIDPTKDTEDDPSHHYVSHLDIVHDDVACTSSGSLPIIPSKTPGDVEVAEIMGLDGDYLFGVESVDRECNETVFKKGSVVFWVGGRDEDVVFEEGGVTLGKGEEWMVVSVKGGGGCVYSVEGGIELGEVVDVSGSPGVEDEEGVGSGSDLGDLDGIVEGEEVDAKCFSGEGVVEVEGKGEVRVRDVGVGDRVRVGEGVWSEVFMFSHRVVEGVWEYVRVEVESGEWVRVSGGHYLYVGGRLVEARKVVVGDLLEIVGEGASWMSRVVDVKCEKRRGGLYNPQTVQGDIVVNGIKASTYTSAVDPRVAHGLLAPLRLLYKVFNRDPSVGLLNGGAERLRKLVPSGRGSY